MVVGEYINRDIMVEFWMWLVSILIQTSWWRFRCGGW